MTAPADHAQRIVIIDDHPLLALGLARALELLGTEVELVEPGLDTDLLVERVVQTADCAVVDLGLPIPGGGHSLIAPLVASGVRVAVLTGETERWQLAQAAHGGAEVVLSKAEPLDDLVEAIVQVAAGVTVRAVQKADLRAEHNRISEDRQRVTKVFASLSGREEIILAGLMDGVSVQHLADRDFVSVQTVRSQVKSVLRKLGVSSQLEAVALANRSGWSLEQEQI